MPAIDLHCDTLTAFMNPDRCEDTLNDPQSAFALCNLPLGERWAQCCAVFLPNEIKGAAAVDYYRRHRDSFRRQMIQFSPLVSQCRTAGDIRQAWEQGKTAALLTIENGSALAGSLERVEELNRDGVVMMTLSWNGRNEIASGWDTDLGLTAFGRRVIPAMEERRMLVDVSHLNDRSFFDVLSCVSRPFVASHSNARAICPHRRNLTDEQILELIRGECLIGVNYYRNFLREDGNPTFDDLFRHIVHILELGGENCLALGSDFDGADIPPFLASPAKVLTLPEKLMERGLTRAVCDKLFYLNALTFLERNRP